MRQSFGEGCFVSFSAKSFVECLKMPEIGAMCRVGRHTFPSLFFAGCVTLPPVKIRARKNPSGVTVYQLDLSLIDGRRVRQTFQNKADAQSALVRAWAKVASEGINALIPSAPEHPNLAKWMLRLEGTGKTLDDVFRWFF
jgi:hypothetical protein